MTIEYLYPIYSNNLKDTNLLNSSSKGAIWQLHLISLDGIVERF